MAGTTQPGRSEGLWAQVAMLQPAVSHTEVKHQPARGIVEGRSKRSVRLGVWRDRSWPRRPCGRLRAELWGAWSL